MVHADLGEKVDKDGLGLCDSAERPKQLALRLRTGSSREGKWRRQQQERRNRCHSHFFMEVNNLEVEEELSTMAALAWAEGMWMGRWAREQKADYAYFRGSGVEASEKACRTRF